MIAIVDYDTGNVGSVFNMIRKAGGTPVITRDPTILRQADKLVLPGVGAFDEAMGNLEKFGLIEILNDLVIDRRKPVLGVCLGAQLMAQESEEGNKPGLGWLDAKLVRFRPAEGLTLRVPHMGWNMVEPQSEGGGIFDDVTRPMRFYFVHSYYMVANDPSIVLARSTYGSEFTSAMAQKNILSMQFHPEKSHKYGLQVYRNFVERFEAC